MKYSKVWRRESFEYSPLTRNQRGRKSLNPGPRPPLTETVAQAAPQVVVQAETRTPAPKRICRSPRLHGKAYSSANEGRPL